MSDSGDYHYRLELLKRLSSLPATQLDRVILTLNLPKGLIPPSTAKPGDRASALFEWADSSIGCGLAKLENVLEEVLAVEQAIAEPPRQESTAGSRRDVHAGSLDNSAVVSGDDNRIEINYYGLPATKPEPTRQDTNEKILIEAVWTEVEDRLRQSLHNAILIRLDMAEQRNQVSRPWDSQLRTANQAAKPLDPNTHIVEVFDRRDVGGKLLILGNPGSGKTTTMLDLAAELIKRANAQPEHPIPVMFNLSSWQSAKQSITDWLLSELKLKYGVSQRLGKTWLAQKTLLPLLDGLDELSPERQEPVVQAINEWLQSGEGPSRLLVCSRVEEYELYAAKLALNGAVCLEPLTDIQLQKYLNSMHMGGLWESLQQDAALLGLVRTPLLLSVSILANDAIEPEQWQQKQTTRERMTYLLDAYVERRLHEAVKSKEYPAGKAPAARQIRHWLIWLARHLKEQSEDEFLIEKIQPSILLKVQHQWLYGLIVGIIIGCLYGLITGLVSGLFSGPTLGCLIGFISGLSFGIMSGILGREWPIGAAKNIEISFKRIIQNSHLEHCLDWLSFGLSFGLNFGIIMGLTSATLTGIFFLIRAFALVILGIESVTSLILIVIFIPFFLSIGIGAGTFFGLIFGLTLGALGGFIEWFSTDILLGLEPNQGIFTSIKNSNVILLVSIFFVFILKSIASLYTDLSPILWIVSIAVVLASIDSDITICAKHLALRVVLYQAQAIPWNYARFLNHCTERLLLQRVGGRYRFIHKLMQEHFAAME